MRSVSTVIFALFIASAACCWADNAPFCYFPQVFPVSMKVSPATVDVNRYMGKWYEVARMPAPFQKDCLCSEANYALDQSGFVKVANTCLKTSGEIAEADGKAYSQNKENTKLNVYFQVPIPGPYWILDIEPNYQWVVVGEPCSKLAWILSRTKQLPQNVLDARISTLQSKGYDVSKLVRRNPSC